VWWAVGPALPERRAEQLLGGLEEDATKFMACEAAAAMKTRARRKRSMAGGGGTLCRCLGKTPLVRK